MSTSRDDTGQYAKDAEQHHHHHLGSHRPDDRPSADPKLLLPATCRDDDDIVVPCADADFLESDLSVRRLNDVHEWLWICGRPMPPRPLHRQRLMLREIVICEDAELHLVWWRHRIFLKPLPPYLLDPDFWTSHIIGGGGGGGSSGSGSGRRTESKEFKDMERFPPMSDLEACARGFLFSYTALIATKSDFDMARECRLIPDELTWRSWKSLTAQFVPEHKYDLVNRRYWYGELRLSRLNKIYSLKGHLVRGYSTAVSHTFYGSVIREHFSVLAAILGYVVVALAAMQVGIGVDRLYESPKFQDATMGFVVFSLLAPLVGGLIIFFVVLLVFIWNWRATKVYKNKRAKKMGVGEL